MKKIIKTDKNNAIRRFKEAVSSRLMLGEPRMVGFFKKSYVQLQHLFGEKAFCIYDFIIHIEAVGRFKQSEDDENITELSYKIIRGYWNPLLILMWYFVFFIPFFFIVASNSLWYMFPPVLLFGLPAIPVGLRVIVTGICSRVMKKADEGIKLLEEEIDYEIERINKYPKFDVKEKPKDGLVPRI